MEISPAKPLFFKELVLSVFFVLRKENDLMVQVTEVKAKRGGVALIALLSLLLALHFLDFLFNGFQFFLEFFRVALQLLNLFSFR